jgi:hypothetical protein
MTAAWQRRESARRRRLGGRACGQAERHRRTLQDLIEHHEMQAAKLCEGEGVGFELH